MKIYLIGMPGSGKSTIGKQLASALELAFVDLDDEIERVLGKKITRVFGEEGEEYFRQVESSQLKAFAHAEVSFVMATGGGAPCFHNGIDVINDTGLSIFLDVRIETILSRLEADQQRPLLAGDDRRTKLEALREQRLQYYNRAQFHVLEPIDVDLLIQEIQTKI